FWDALCQGRSGAKPVTCMDTSKLPRRSACTIDEPVDESIVGGRAAKLAVMAARQAMADAGLGRSLPAGARCDISMGTTMGETEFIEDKLHEDDAVWLGPEHVRRIVSGQPGVIARAVQSDCGAVGEADDLYGACAAGNMAITLASRALASKQCDIALAGGSDGFSQLAFIGFMRLRLMAAEQSRPFDKKRDGLLVGEGATVFVLERASSAAARGARVRARVAGSAMTSESYHPTRPDPEGDGLTRAIQGALASADMAAADIDYVNAHGTGTPQNDMIEAKVMDKCLRPGTPFSSTKALTGHTMGAAGAMEAAACVLSMERQMLVPTWHLQDVLEPCLMDAVRDGPRPAVVRAVLNNSAGFGGYNSSVVLTAS
ncbi:MAG: beta-ketoacyl synthase N-terminal-like domain-containing protein, partial [Phycisphaerae bacterium]